jgi:hypothetical protein
MNDLELIRDLRPQVPLADSSELAVSRERLIAAVAAGNRHPRRAPTAGKRLRPSGRVALGAAIGVAATGIAVTVLLSSVVPSRVVSSALSHPRDGRSAAAAAHPHRIVMPATLTAAQFLKSAAAATAHQTAVLPVAGQYVYSENSTPGGGWSKEWLSANGAEPGLDEDSASPPGYAFTEPACTVAQAEATGCYLSAGYLPGLPAQPNAVLAYLARLGLAAATPPYSDEPANWMANDLGKAVGFLMSYTYLLPAQQSAIFRLLAQTPGFQIVRSATDPVGRPGVGIYWSYQGGGAMIVFDPATYAFLGFGTWPSGDQPVLTGQNVTAPDGSALTAMAIVNALPPHQSFSPSTGPIQQVRQWAAKTHQRGTLIQIVTAYLREVLHLSPAKVHSMLIKLGIGRPASTALHA